MPHILVIGLNSLGQTLARELAIRGAHVTVADRDQTRISRIMSTVQDALALDTTKKAALEQLEIERFDNIVVCMGHEFEDAELTTLALKDLEAKHITVMATTRQRRQILETIGADYVMTPGLQQARDLAMTLTEEAFNEFRYFNDDQGVAEVETKGLVTLDREFHAAIAKFNVRVVGFKHGHVADEMFTCVVEEPVTLRVGDSVLFFGRPEDIARAARKKLK